MYEGSDLTAGSFTGSTGRAALIFPNRYPLTVSDAIKPITSDAMRIVVIIFSNKKAAHSEAVNSASK
jgi:hypothetical protein